MNTRNSSPVARRLLGVFLLLHGLAHSLPAIRTTDAAAGWLNPAERQPIFFVLELLLWATSAAGFMAAGLGLIGARVLRPHWSVLAFGAALTSVILLLFKLPPYAMVGIVIDVALLVAVYRVGNRWRTPEAARHRWRPLLGSALAVLLVAYTVVVILARPLIMSEGARPEEIRMSMLGDQPMAGAATYAIHHAITIDAPPERVWPWLAQIGQDKAGFYSHAFLENLAGCHLRNADRLHPEWQQVRTGDTIWATPPDYLGTGKRVGWHVDLAEPERALVLHNWGQFVLLPQADGSTRLVVRTRASHPTRLTDIALAPLGVLLFEPAHFIMQREMLAGIKQRVESNM